MPFRELLIKPNTITELELWKDKYYIYFLKVSKQSSCSVRCEKWMSNTFVLPCICKQRETNCFLSQFYYEVNKLIKKQGYEVDCENAILDFYKLNKTEEDYTKWLNSFEDLYYKVRSSEYFQIKNDSQNFTKVEAIIPQTSKDFLDLYKQVTNVNFEPKIIPFEFLRAIPLKIYPESYLKSIKHLGKLLKKGKYLNVYLRNNIHYFDDIHYEENHCNIYGITYLSSPKLFFHKTYLKTVEYDFEFLEYEYIKKKLKRDSNLVKPLDVKTISKEDVFKIIYLDAEIKLFKKDCNTITLSISENEK